jgi:Spy/CpxP family protein refolding chaperone
MNRTRALSLACSLLLTTPLAFSQGPGGPGGQGGPDMPHPMDRGEGRGMGRGMERGEGHGMGILPMGAWWKNPGTVALLGLSSDQQKHMDDIMLQSRIQLIHMKASLEEEQLKLEPLLNANPVDQSKALAQISKIADLRADLEKSNAKMLLSLRSNLTADQWTKLQSQRHNHRDGGPEGFGGRRGQDNMPSTASPNLRPGTNAPHPSGPADDSGPAL